jgi:hypothetical protein
MGQLRKRGGIWWIRYYRNGQRFDESSGSSKKGAAVDLLKTKEGDIVPSNRRRSPVAIGPKKSGRSCSAF